MAEFIELHDFGGHRMLVNVDDIMLVKEHSAGHGNRNASIKCKGDLELFYEVRENYDEVVDLIYSDLVRPVTDPTDGGGNG